MAEEARSAWKALEGNLGDQLWMRHVEGHSGHVYNDKAEIG